MDIGSNRSSFISTDF